MSPFRRGGGGGGKVDWLIVGLGNPGREYAGTRHNVGFEVVALAAERWDLPKAKKKFNALYTDGRTGPGGPRVASPAAADLHERVGPRGVARRGGRGRRP